MADLTPEHTSRRTEGDLHPEVREAYRYVDSVVATADFEHPLAWCGWALREAFLAGCTHARAALAEEPAAPAPPADGEVAELVVWLLDEAIQAADASQPTAAGMLTWAAQVVGEHAELLQRQALVPAPPADGEVNDLSHLSDAEFNALCPHDGHAPGPEPLSPAAQAVLDAAIRAAESPDAEAIAAAVLRAAADQVVPEESPPNGGMRPGGTGALTLDEAQGFQRAATRRRILAIAAELENH